MTVERESAMTIDALEIENARNLTMLQLAGTFIPTKLFVRLLSRKNNVLFGARGQGKTALFRMLSFPGMRMLANKYTFIKKIVADKQAFGIYLPTKLEWVQTLFSQLGAHGINSSDAFMWKLNLSSCIAFLETVKACLDEYCERRDRIYVERQFCKRISREWSLSKDCHTVAEVLECLEGIGYEWQTTLAMCKITESSAPRKRASHLEAFSVFSNMVFIPLQRGIAILSALLKIRKTAMWFLCIDEAEYMVPEHQKIINAFMRGAPGNLFVKIATLPFSYNTLETGISNAPVVAGHDFEYLHMDDGGSEMVEDSEQQSRGKKEGGVDKEFVFAEMLFQKVVHEYFREVGDVRDLLSSVFGGCKLLDSNVDEAWDEDSPYLVLLKKYATPCFYSRALNLFSAEDKTRFMNEVGRKVRGTLVLREDYANRGGHRKSGLYSGARMIVKCAEGNPRRLISILKSLIGGCVHAGGIKPVKSSRQEEVLVEIASNLFNQLRSYQNVGPEMYQLVKNVGEYLRDELYSMPLTGDVCMSFSIRECDTNNDERQDEMLRAAIAFGVVKPNDLTKINYGDRSCLSGAYHLSYVFCPLFRLQPRKGRAVDLARIYKCRPRHGVTPRKKKVSGSNQLMLDL